MKNIFGYGLLSFFIAFCYHLGVTETIAIHTDESCESYAQLQFVAQNGQNANQLTGKCYHHRQEMPCDLTKTTQDVPAAKYIIRKTTPIGKSHPAQNDSANSLFETHAHCPPKPVSYFVFGLRKIII